MKRILIFSFFILNLFTIVFFWWSNSGPQLFQGISLAFISLGRLCGLFAVYAVLLQLVLIGRSPWIEKIFGLDKLSRIHRLNGKIAICFILLHPLLLTLGYSLDRKTGFIHQFLFFVTKFEDVFEAFIAVILFSFIVFLSLSIARKRLKYETWYYVHIFNYLAIFLAWSHQLKNGEDFLSNNLFVFYWYGLYIFVLINHILFRFIRPWFNFFKYRFYVTDIIHETDDVISVIITGKNIENFKVKPGQFLIVRFLTKDLWWQAHPFSFSKYPDGQSIRLSIKNVGDFTSVIPRIKKGSYVYIDGPFGIFTKEVITKEKILFIAGGIGITPIRSLLEQLVREKRDIVLMYSNKIKKEIVFKNEFDKLQKEFSFSVYYFLSQEQESGFYSGRIDGQQIEKLVKDFKKRDIFLCGPVSMMDAIKKDLLVRGVPAHQIHYEQFSL